MVIYMLSSADEGLSHTRSIQVRNLIVLTPELVYPLLQSTRAPYFPLFSAADREKDDWATISKGLPAVADWLPPHTAHLSAQMTPPFAGKQSPKRQCLRLQKARQNLE